MSVLLVAEHDNSKLKPFTLNAISSDVDSLIVDDAYTDVVELGFNFDFYGNTYSKMLISSNGYVTFDTTNAGGYSPYSVTKPIPNPGNEPENAIMVPWHDPDPNIGGAIYFGSFGTSPNKVYVVTWCAAITSSSALVEGVALFGVVVALLQGS